MFAFTDIHSHVLHGVDDGSSDIGVALATLRQMQKVGVNRLILTPHYCKRRGYEASARRIEAAYKELCQAARDARIGVSLYLGTEMEYSNDAIRYIKEGRVHTLAGSRYLLVEFAPYVTIDTIAKGCKEIMQLGLVPVVAHIERYETVRDNIDFLYFLKDMGAEIQINVRSVCAGGFGMRRFLKKVFSNQLADYIAGDVHAYPLDRKEMEKCNAFIIKHSSVDYLKRLTGINAEKIICGG